MFSPFARAGVLADTSQILKTYYQDLKTAFAVFRSHHPNEHTGTLYLKSRYHHVCWTQDDPYDHEAHYGEAAILDDQVEFEIVNFKGKVISVVEIGRVFGFPLDGSILYYCGDNDMVYFFTFEGLENEPKGQRRKVLEFRRFSDILKEFE